MIDSKYLSVDVGSSPSCTIKIVSMVFHSSWSKISPLKIITMRILYREALIFAPVPSQGPDFHHHFSWYVLFVCISRCQFIVINVF